MFESIISIHWDAVLAGTGGLIFLMAIIFGALSIKKLSDQGDK